MIIIAYNELNVITSIVAAKSKELAVVYFQGANINAFCVKCLEEDFTPLSEHPTGVIPILKTTVRELKDWNMRDYKPFVVVIE